jgi:hypothetical protein
VLRTTRDVGIYVKALIQVPESGNSSCVVGAPELTYRWLFNLEEKGAAIFRLNAKTKNSKNLYIEPFTMNAGQVGVASRSRVFVPFLCRFVCFHFMWCSCLCFPLGSLSLRSVCFRFARVAFVLLGLLPFRSGCFRFARVAFVSLGLLLFRSGCFRFARVASVSLGLLSFRSGCFRFARVAFGSLGLLPFRLGCFRLARVAFVSLGLLSFHRPPLALAITGRVLSLLLLQVYFLKVEGTVDGQPELFNVATATIICVFSDLDPVIIMPMQMLRTDGLTIDASGSVDVDDPNPARPEYPFGLFQYFFACYNVTGDGVTINQFPYQDCFDDPEGLLYPPPASGVLALPNGTLAPGQYRFEIGTFKEPFFSPVDGSRLNRQPERVRVIEVLNPTTSSLMTNVTLDLPFETYNKTTRRKGEFLEAFRADMSGNLRVEVARIDVTEVVLGSVTVQFLIHPRSLLDTGMILSDIILWQQFEGIVMTFPGLEELLVDDFEMLELLPEVVAVNQMAFVYVIPDSTIDLEKVKMPNVLLSLPQYDAGIVNANEKVVIRGTLVDLSQLNNTAFYWQLLEGILDLDAYPALLATPRNSSNLVIKKDVLSAASHYKLRLNAMDINSGMVGHSDIEFIANGAPTSGTCTMFPYVGFTAETDFTITCLGKLALGFTQLTLEFLDWHLYSPNWHLYSPNWHLNSPIWQLNSPNRHLNSHNCLLNSPNWHSNSPIWHLNSQVGRTATARTRWSLK